MLKLQCTAVSSQKWNWAKGCWCEKDGVNLAVWSCTGSPEIPRLTLLKPSRWLEGALRVWAIRTWYSESTSSQWPKPQDVPSWVKFFLGFEGPELGYKKFLLRPPWCSPWKSAKWAHQPVHRPALQAVDGPISSVWDHLWLFNIACMQNCVVAAILWHQLFDARPAIFCARKDLQPRVVARNLQHQQLHFATIAPAPVLPFLHTRDLDSLLFQLYYRRKFRSETSDNMDSWKAEVRRVRREKIRRKKMQMREKVGKSRFTVFFQWFVAPEGRKVGSLKRRVQRHLARWEMKKCTPLWREAHFQVKMYKTPQLRTTFGSWDVEKVHAVVARSTFPSQNVQNTPWSDHFWKLRCRKSARRCGAKHISKSKCTKHTMVGPLFEVEMSKKCTPLWREAHFQVKMYKAPHARATFGGSDVEKVSKKCTPLWREAHFKVKSVKNWGFWAFFDVKMSKK